ncbi:MAG: hypothetical protein WA093_05175 [Minisyncoccales bacterium]
MFGRKVSFKFGRLVKSLELGKDLEEKIFWKNSMNAYKIEL